MTIIMEMEQYIVIGFFVIAVLGASLTCVMSAINNIRETMRKD